MMGGTGGGYDFSSGPSPEDLRKKVQKSKDEEKAKQFERELEGFLNRMLTEFNDRDIEKTNQHLETIKKALGKDIDGTVNLCFGGSVHKHTYVDGISDVDSLVLLNDTELSKLSPSEVKKYFFERLQERLPNTTITMGKMAVTVKFRDHDAQLLPAVKTDSGFLVTSPDGKKWSSVRPQKFAENLTKMNKSCGWKLVPTIKMAKGIISSLPEMKRLSGYHTEALASSIFSSYKGPHMVKDMIRHFFTEASKRVLTPIKDPSGQSTYVDKYLGKSGGLQRKVVADSLSRISRKMNNADEANSLNAWKDLFGEF
jgi:hypothetical protein